ncbi:DNA repair and recombination protein RadB [Candidatus Woesearchaeota archaeon]|nr:DNA repair and recombination protein RadB [Candidatus Woesearchaeota archaeon]
MKKRIGLGFDFFDEFLDGGFEKGIINNVYGPAGSGKSLVCMLCALSVIKDGKRVIYVDTEAGFSLERFAQLDEDYKEHLDKIFFLKPNSFEEQRSVFEKMKEVINKDVGLIIVDSISMLYRLELGRADQVYNTNRELGLQVNFLSEAARKNNICVLITSHVYSDFENKEKIRMVGGDFLKYSSKCLLELENLSGGLRHAILVKHRSIEENKTTSFSIVKEGIRKEKKD